MCKIFASYLLTTTFFFNGYNTDRDLNGYSYGSTILRMVRVFYLLSMSSFIYRTTTTNQQ